MRKTVKLSIISINEIDGRVKAIDQDSNDIKMTRAQRELLTEYDSPDFKENMIREFGRKDILDDVAVHITESNGETKVVLL